MGKIKQFVESDRGKDILTVLIVILVGLASFELGGLSKGGNSSGIKIEYPVGLNQEANVVSALENVSGTTAQAKVTSKNFFASNRGTKYYSLGCSGGKTIKQENRIYFATREAAEAAGYELSSSCK